MDLCIAHPLAPHWSQRAARDQAAIGGSVDRVAALLLLEQIGDDVAARGQAHLVAFDLGDEAARDVMVMLLMADAADGADQLDAVVLDPVDGADMGSVGADHFHMFANVFEATHGFCLLVPAPNAPLAALDARRALRQRAGPVTCCAPDWTLSPRAMADVRTTTLPDAQVAPEAPPSPTHVAVRREDYRPPDWRAPGEARDATLVAPGSGGGRHPAVEGHSHSSTRPRAATAGPWRPSVPTQR